MSQPLTPGGAAPPPQPPPPAAARPGNPWDRRAELGFGRALVDTLVLFVTNPERGFDDTREKGDLAGPLIFAILLGWVGVIINQAWQSMFGASILSMMPPEVGEQFGPMMFSGIGFVASLLLAPVYVLIGLFLGAAILHVCLMLLGGLNDSRSGFEGTFRVVSFSTVAQLANVIPLAGGLISMLWTIVLYVLGLSSLHRTTRGRALIAALIPLVLCCLCLAVVMVFSVGMLATFLANQ